MNKEPQYDPHPIIDGYDVRGEPMTSDDPDILKKLGWFAIPCNPATVEGIAAEAIDEIERLRRWKDEALTVLTEWENVWDQAGRPGTLGSSKALAVGHEIERLRADLVEASANQKEWNGP